MDIFQNNINLLPKENNIASVVGNSVMTGAFLGLSVEHVKNVVLLYQLHNLNVTDVSDTAMVMLGVVFFGYRVIREKKKYENYILNNPNTKKFTLKRK